MKKIFAVGIFAFIIFGMVSFVMTAWDQTMTDEELSEFIVKYPENEKLRKYGEERGLYSGYDYGDEDGSELIALFEQAKD